VPSGDPTEYYSFHERGAAVTVSAMDATGHLPCCVHFGEAGPAVHIDLQTTDRHCHIYQVKALLPENPDRLRH
jgi:hypothetical protein